MSNALFYFDSMLDGKHLEIIQFEPIIHKQINPESIVILQKLIHSKLNQTCLAGVDSYMMDTFTAFCEKRTTIKLYYDIIYKQYAVIAKSIFHSIDDVSFRYMRATPSENNVNLFKCCIFTLFPNLEEILMDIRWGEFGNYCFSFWNFVSNYSNQKKWKPTTTITILQNRIIVAEKEHQYLQELNYLLTMNGLSVNGKSRKDRRDPYTLFIQKHSDGNPCRNNKIGPTILNYKKRTGLIASFKFEPSHIQKYQYSKRNDG